MNKEKLKKNIKLVITVVIIILFIWFIIISPYITFRKNEKLMEEAAKRYYELNEEKLPTGKRTSTITLKDLYKGGYVTKDIYLPYSKEPCSLTDSWVKTKQENNDYKYHVYLQCGVLKSKTDHKGPTIILNGDEEITINNGEEYKELGVKKVTDNTDGKIDIKKVEIDSSKVNTKKNGTYEVVYTVSDSFNNKTTKIRKINVIQTISHVVKTNTNNGMYKGEEENNYLLLSNIKFRIIGLDNNNVKLVTDSDISNIDYNGINDWLDYFYDNLTEEAKKYIVKNTYCNNKTDMTNIDSNNDCNSKTKNKLVYLLSVKDMNDSKDQNGISYLFPSTISWLANEVSDSTSLTTRDSFSGTNSQFMEFDKNYSFGIRPALTIKGDSLIKGGDGTRENPYTFKETKTGKEDDYLNTRYTGEYITFSNRDFRIIKTEQDGTTKVVSTDTILDNIGYKTEDTSKIYNPKQKGNIGYIINQKTSSQINDEYFVNKEIEVPIYKNYANYKKEEETKKYKVKFSSPNTFELFSALEEYRSYWLINSSKTKYRKYIVSDIGVIYYSEVPDNETAGARIVGYLNSKCKILSGSGTKEDPYKIVK